MLNIISNSGDKTYGINEYVCDALTDIINLPTNCSMGSKAYVIEGSLTFTKNGKGQWI
jgi:hypothetical protein